MLPLAAAIVWTFFNELLGRYTRSLASLAYARASYRVRCSDMPNVT